MPERTAVAADTDTQIILEALKVVARMATRGEVRAFGIVANCTSGQVVGHHVCPDADPHALRGLIAELSDQVRDNYVKTQPGPTLFSADGATVPPTPGERH